jgi:hypothetical protein
VKSVADKLNTDEHAIGIEPIGLRPNFPGLKHVYREGDPHADAKRQPRDFYSADRFNYVTLQISADGKSLTVDTLGNRFLSPEQLPLTEQDRRAAPHPWLPDRDRLSTTLPGGLVQSVPLETKRGAAAPPDRFAAVSPHRFVRQDYPASTSHTRATGLAP